MAISIQTNVTSQGTQRTLDTSQSSLATSIHRLSSGFRVNSAADDAAALTQSEKLRADIRSTAQAVRNGNDGISLLQVAEGSLNEIGGILGKMRELATQSTNGTIGSTERNFIHSEFVSLRSEIDRLANTTEFNSQKLLNGSSSASFVQIGIRNSSNDRINISLASAAATSLGIGATSLSTSTNAQNALTSLDSAINNVSSRRANIGALQNRILSTLSNLGISREVLSAANSRIRDVDVAEETAAMTRNQIISQAGAAMLAQANSAPQIALSLLQ